MTLYESYTAAVCSCARVNSQQPQPHVVANVIMSSCWSCYWFCTTQRFVQRLATGQQILEDDGSDRRYFCGLTRGVLQGSRCVLADTILEHLNALICAAGERTGHGNSG
jgi:hypothetical protein